MRRSVIIAVMFAGMMLPACSEDQPSSPLDRENSEPGTAWVLPPSGVAALVGALAGAAATHLFSLFRESEARRRERDGLLRLVFWEVFANRIWLFHWYHISGSLQKSPEGVLQWTTWEGVRARLAQLLEDEQMFSDIAQFYGTVRYIEGHRRVEQRSVLPNGVDLAEGAVPRAKYLGEEISKGIPRYVPDAAGAAQQAGGQQPSAGSSR